MVVSFFIKYGIKPIQLQKVEVVGIPLIFLLSLVYFKTPMPYQCSQIILSRRTVRAQQFHFKSLDVAKPEWEFQAWVLGGCFPSSVCYLAIQGAKFADNIYLSPLMPWGYCF